MMPFLNIHTHHLHKFENVESILSLSVGHDDLKSIKDHHVAVGIHPWFINLTTIEEDLASLNALVLQPNVKMIGECGLDTLKGAPFEKQLALFEAQLLMAKKLKKPLVIHCVKAYDELIALYKKVMPGVAMVIHGFNKSEQLGKQLLNQGFSLSFGKAILNENSGAAMLVREIDDFFLETDDSELTIEQVYEAAAKLKNITVDELKALIFANWKKLNLI